MKNINITRTLKSQNGASIGSVIFNVGLLILLGFMAAKVAVFYIDNRTINNTLQDLADVPYVTKKSRGEVSEILRKKLRANNLELSKEEIAIEKRSDRLVVDVVYERRVNMIGNLDVVVSFENNFEAIKQ